MARPGPVVLLDVVGLTPRMLGPDAPNLTALARAGGTAPLRGVIPAVTCSAQATMLTGVPPNRHGVVGNGWYFRDLAEVWLWRQSNHLIEAPQLWAEARRRRPGLVGAKLFWWFNLHGEADLSVTPRPTYPADGRKIPDIYTRPRSLREELVAELGPFPLFEFWGPRAGLRSSAWIARAAVHVLERHAPDLALVYLPHLDYDLQRHGPGGEPARRALAEVDRAAGEVVRAALERGGEVLCVSEYGIEAADRPVHVNRALREAGLLEVHAPLGLELLDAGASRAFAVADHQIAHVYVREARDVAAARAVLEALPGVARVLDRAEQRELALDHPRSGELVALAERGAWFAYYYWLDDARAPDFARTVDIHRKPGYDPVELFLAPGPLTKARLAMRLTQKALGMRYLLDVIPLDATLVRGTHGRPPDDPRDGPIVISSNARRLTAPPSMEDVPRLVHEALAGA